MQSKKTPKADLENKRGIFSLIGLIVAIVVVIVAFEWRTYEQKLMDLGAVNLDLEEEIIPITEREKKPPPPPPPPPEVIEVVEDDVEIEKELEIQDQDFDEEEVFEIAEPEEEEEIGPINFMVVENKPVYPGCEKYKNAEEQYTCFQQMIAEHIKKTFKYPPIAKDMGVQGKVFVNFVIDKNGNISNATVVRSVDKHLDAEAVRIVNALPKMTPASQRGKAVPVTFTVPINFKLQ